LVAETGLEPASTDYESDPGGFTTPVHSALNFSNWLRRKDSNLRMTRFRNERRSTWLLRKVIPDCQRRLPICTWSAVANAAHQSEISNQKSEMSWWTWHDLNVRPRPSQSRALRSAELQVLTLPIANCRAHDSSLGNESAMCWRRWSDSNAHRISPGTLAGCCHAS
jgi:hypothetical protein